MAMRLVFCRARENQAAVQEYLSLLEPAFRLQTEMSSLFATRDDLLRASDAVIALGRVDKQTVGGLHLVEDGLQVGHLQGLRIHPEFRGRRYSSRLVRETLVWGNDALGISRFALNVRCNDRGEPREPTHSGYRACGFEDDGSPIQVVISGEFVDAHLGPPGTSFLTQSMVAGPAAVAAARVRINKEEGG